MKNLVLQKLNQLNNFKIIAELPNVQLISLQKGESEKDLKNVDFPIKSFDGEIGFGMGKSP